MTDLIYPIWFSLCCGPASPLAQPLLEKSGGYERIYQNRHEISKLYPRFRSLRKRLNELPLEAAQKVADWCEENGVRIFYRGGEHWPKALENVPNAPILLYAKGDFEIFEGLESIPTVTVVGTRSMSTHGEKAAYEFSYILAATGMCVISGMAAGVDGVAHRAALDAGGKTISVWGCGIDRVYPSAHRELAEKIAQSGLILTEYAPGALPEKQNFPQRNRIMAALGMGTLVIEAKSRSGSLITANIAGDIGRSVYAVMTDYDRRGSDAMRDLIAGGAYAVSGAADLWAEYSREFDIKPDEGLLAQACERLAEAAPLPETDFLPAAHTAPERETDTAYVLPDYVTGDAKTVYEALESGEAEHVDGLSEKLEMTTMRVAAALTLLELEGAVTCLPGRHYIKNGK